MDTIRNPIEWGADELETARAHVAAVGQSLKGSGSGSATGDLELRPVTLSDLRKVLAKGFADFRACRTDVLFLCLVYPAVGLVAAWFTFDYSLLPLILPILSGVAFLGPVTAIGLYQMSRQREQGQEVNWLTAFAVLGSPRFGAMLVLGLVMLAIFLLWLAAADGIYAATLGPAPPVSLAGFVSDVFTTGAGWAMILIGTVVGALFAVVVLALSVVSFPLLLDREIGLSRAVKTSVRVVAANPWSMLVWGLIIAIGLAVGSIPLFLGLILVMPVLGHATWHLYRAAVA